MPEQIGGALYDEEAQSKTVAPALIRPLKGIDDSRQSIGAYAGSGVAHADVQPLPR
jgi:hypothetical protein